MGDALQQAAEAAHRWRREHAKYVGGVVLVWDGQAYGWKNALRNADHERPGAFAVDVAGHVFVAEGGNDDDGARCWVAVL